MHVEFQARPHPAYLQTQLGGDAVSRTLHHLQAPVVSAGDLASEETAWNMLSTVSTPLLSFKTDLLPGVLSCMCCHVAGLADRAAAARQRLLQHQQAQAISQAPSLSGLLGGSTQQQYTQGSAAAAGVLETERTPAAVAVTCTPTSLWQHHCHA